MISEQGSLHFDRLKVASDGAECLDEAGTVITCDGPKQLSYEHTDWAQCLSVDADETGVYFLIMSSDLKPNLVIIDFDSGSIVKSFPSTGLDLSFDATSFYNSASFYLPTFDYFFFGKTSRLYTQGLANEVGYIASLITGRPISLLSNYN
jgi:hypothetical protein